MKVLVFAAPIVLAVFCLVQLVQSDEHEVRHLPRLAWGAVIVLLPVLGPVAWLVAGRPLPGRPPQRQTRVLAPDDDPDFLRSLRNRQHPGGEPPEQRN